jgi:hypothetical protein
MSDWTYALTDQDRALAERLARRRDAGKPNQCHNGAVTEEESRTRHCKGLFGEIAFARRFGYEVDRVKRGGGDDGADFTSPQGHRIDVKHRTEPGKDLALKGTGFEDFTSHFLVLSWQASDRQVRLVGWCTAARMTIKGQVSHWAGVGEKRYIEPQDLANMDVLQTMIGSGSAAYA